MCKTLSVSLTHHKVFTRHFTFSRTQQQRGQTCGTLFSILPHYPLVCNLGRKQILYKMYLPKQHLLQGSIFISDPSAVTHSSLWTQSTSIRTLVLLWCLLTTKIIKNVPAAILQLTHRQIKQQRIKILHWSYWNTAGKWGEIYEEIHGLATNRRSVSAYSPQMLKDPCRTHALARTKLDSFEGQIS